jgi:P27 family predicted phage terminase small subunit
VSKGWTKPGPGRRPKPLGLHLIDGTLRPDRHGSVQNVPQPQLGIAEAPAFLGAYAREEWNRVAPELNTMGILAYVDMASLAGYCMAFERMALAEEALQAERQRESERREASRAKRKPINRYALVSYNAAGSPRQNPLVKIVAEASVEMLKFASEFGMTPAARMKLRGTANTGDNLTNRAEDQQSGPDHGDQTGPGEYFAN